MSNSALSTLRTKVRILLNESTAGFWTDAVLNDFIQSAFEHYYREFLGIDHTYGRHYEDITYTAAAEYYSVSNNVERIVEIEDRTSTQPGQVLIRADSLKQLLDMSVNVYAQASTVPRPPFWYFEKIEGISSGVVTVSQYLYLAPKPSSARSLRLHCQKEPQALGTADTYTTGLPEFVERCIVIAAAIDAKLMESSPNIVGFQGMLAQAEQRMYKHARSTQRGPRRIVYDEDLAN